MDDNEITTYLTEIADKIVGQKPEKLAGALTQAGFSSYTQNDYVYMREPCKVCKSNRLGMKVKDRDSHKIEWKCFTRGCTFNQFGKGQTHSYHNGLAGLLDYLCTPNPLLRENRFGAKKGIQKLIDHLFVKRPESPTVYPINPHLGKTLELVPPSILYFALLQGRAKQLWNARGDIEFYLEKALDANLDVISPSKTVLSAPVPPRDEDILGIPPGAPANSFRPSFEVYQHQLRRQRAH